MSLVLLVASLMAVPHAEPFSLTLQTRAADGAVSTRKESWDPKATAVIVCDMWDDHHCKIAAQRVGLMAPRMNQVLTAARDRGVMIIHAPSNTMKFYESSPYRARMVAARPAKPSSRSLGLGIVPQPAVRISLLMQQTGPVIGRGVNDVPAF